MLEESAPEDGPSKTQIIEKSGNKIVSVPTLPVNEVTKDQISAGSNEQAVEASKVAPLVVGPPINSLPNSAAMQGINTAFDHTTAKIVPSGTINTPHPSIVGSESAHPCPSEPMPVKRQGRKAQKRVEPPRRRGRKPSSTSADAHADQDPKLNQHSQNSSGEMLVTKATTVSKLGSEVQDLTNVTQAQSCQIHLPSVVAFQDSKR